MRTTAVCLRDLVKACMQFRAARQAMATGDVTTRELLVQSEHRLFALLGELEANYDAQVSVTAVRVERRVRIEVHRALSQESLMYRSVAKVPARVVAIKREGESADPRMNPGVVTLEQPGGKGSFKLNLSAEQCCGLEDAGDVEFQIHRRVQDGQPAGRA